LSTWLRDYLYLPLAYAISRRIRSERLLHVRAEMVAYSVATLVTMLLCGLWHGASWGCALWGLWHGLFLVVENTKVGRRLLRRCGGPVRFVLAQWVVLMGWVFFRSGTLAQGVSLLRAMYGVGWEGARPVEPTALSAYVDPPVALALCLGLAFCVPLGPWLRRRALDRVRPLRDAHAWIGAVLAAGIIVFLLVLLLASAMSLAEGTYAPFVYQQF
jgi:alginate O-acetyltransferase complex protein AlgI